MPAVTPYPLAPGTVDSNGVLTVDLALSQPTRITRRIRDISVQRFLADRLFTSSGGVTGGAVIYDRQQANELYAARDVERISPGATFPVITGTVEVPSVATVEKWGGKFDITDEARDRNDIALFNRQTTQLANTIVRKHNARAMAAVTAAVAETGQTFAGNNWGAVVTAGSSASTASAYPQADIARAQEVADVQELGVMFDILITNPTQARVLRTIYGSDLNAMLGDNGIQEMFVSNRVTAGKAYVAARGQVGQVRNEQPLRTVAIRDEDHERTWVQSGVRDVIFVDAPYQVLEITGLAG
jgi:hypothetical protein